MSFEATPDRGWFEALTGARLVTGDAPAATNVVHDSRRVTPGAVFVAIRGATSDGNAYIESALQKGASAVIVQENLREQWEGRISGAACVVAVPDARSALAQAAAGLYGHPARSLGVVGITGTDGKTTTTHLVAHMLSSCGQRAGYLSSVEFGDGAGSAELNASHMTTVEADEVQRRLAAMRAAGARYAVLEASSIGLEMHRIDECEFDAAVFTNLKQDHLDFHGTMDAYRGAKAMLFQMVAQSTEKGLTKAAIVNADDAASSAMRAAAGGVPALTYGLGDGCDVSARAIEQSAGGTSFRLVVDGRAIAVTTPLLGEFNVYNCLAAVAVAISQGIDAADAAAALVSFRGVAGRMERIDEGQAFAVIVDIASTEQAMRNVLGVLRPVTPGRLIVLFGAAGERDPERRWGIARAVAERADYAVVTNEDPRTEDPGAIIDEIARALAKEGFGADQVLRLGDRRTAIASAFDMAGPGDTVLLAGKGTEQSIVTGTTHRPWDERNVARELLRARSAV